MFKKVILILLVITFTACKSKKNTNNTTNTSNMFAEKVITNYNNYAFNKRTTKALIKAKYTGKTNLPSFNVSLRMEKDKVIWMSISKFINIGKLLITPNRVQFYNKLQQEYFDGDFTLLSNFLGTEVNFDQVQKILLGEAVFNLDQESYNIETQKEGYLFTPKKQNKLFDILFLLNTNNFKINKQEINQQKEGKFLSITYPEYQQIDDISFPKSIYVLAKDNKNTNTVTIDFKNVEFNTDLNFKFKIPSGYKEIKL